MPPPATDRAPPTDVERVPDVLIIGGGPGGSTLAALLAGRGHDVLLLEKDHHPRFHIGESLLPYNLELFERLGVLNQVHDLGIKKIGADFNTFASEYDPPRHDADFSNQLDRTKPTYAFEVRRSELDLMLLQHCQSQGAEVREGPRVTGVELRKGDDPLVRFRSNDAKTGRVRARFIVDGSGRDAVIANQLGIKRKNRKHDSVAMYAHFEKVARREGDGAGNISIYWFQHGWIWLIPLPDGSMSIGAVCDPGYLKRRTAPVDELFDQTLALGPEELQVRMRMAERVTSVTSTGNYSYRADKIAGDRWALIGDAYAFVDPVFSSGVLLAMQSAFAIVPAIEASLRCDDRGYRRAVRTYRSRHRRALDVLSWFIERFNTPAMKQLLMRPNNPLRVEEAVVSMLTGDVFHNRAVLRRLSLFKLIYAATSLRYRHHA